MFPFMINFKKCSLLKLENDWTHETILKFPPPGHHLPPKPCILGTIYTRALLSMARASIALDKCMLRAIPSSPSVSTKWSNVTHIVIYSHQLQYRWGTCRKESKVYISDTRFVNTIRQTYHNTGMTHINLKSDAQALRRRSMAAWADIKTLSKTWLVINAFGQSKEKPDAVASLRSESAKSRDRIGSGTSPQPSPHLSKSSSRVEKGKKR